MLLGSIPFGRAAFAQTRLGLHVTREELNIWKQRMTDNVNGINGYSFQNIYQNRILADANTFKAQSHPGGDGSWVGYTGTGCIPGGQSIVPGRSNGLKIFKSAFHFLLTGDASFADPVKTELLNQITLAGTNWANASKWCPYNGTTNRIYDANAFETLPWLMRLLFAYDYLLAGGYSGFTAQQRTDINNWFHNAGLVWDTVLTGTITFNAMSKAFNTPPDFTCDGNCSGQDALLYFGGPNAQNPQAVWNNRLSSAGAFSTIVGVFTNDTTLKTHGTIWFQTNIRFGSYGDGMVYDISRWRDCADATPCPRSAWGHAGGTWSSLVGIADTIARTGDTSLYTFLSPGGINGSGGNSVGLLKILQTTAQMANHTLVRYGTSLSGSQNFAHQITWDSNGDSYWDFIMAVANIYYNNPEVHTAATRNLRSGVTGCADNQYGCFNGEYVSYPDIPFMFGNMEGKVNPYNLTSVSTPAAPSLLSISVQ